MSENDFPRLPAFQDKNLLVAITFYKNESEYQSKLKQLDSAIGTELKNEMLETVTTKNTIILYPTK